VSSQPHHLQDLRDSHEEAQRGTKREAGRFTGSEEFNAEERINAKAQRRKDAEPNKGRDPGISTGPTERSTSNVQRPTPKVALGVFVCLEVDVRCRQSRVSCRGGLASPEPRLRSSRHRPPLGAYFKVGRWTLNVGRSCGFRCVSVVFPVRSSHLGGSYVF